MRKKLCVFCSSSDLVDKFYFGQAALLGKQMADNDISLYFGGAKVGLMGTIARSVKENGGAVIGILPEIISDRELACVSCDQLIITPDMNSRKKKLIEDSNAFLALPGGFGTLDELMEVLTLKQLEIIDSPIIIMNQRGYYDGLLKQFEAAFSENFTKREYHKLYFVTDNVEEAIDYLKKYETPELGSKWFKTNLKL